MKPLTADEAYNRLAARCAASEQCRKDLAAKLYAWKIAHDTAEQILDRLETEHYLDEGRYSLALARDKARFDGWGSLKIRQALYQKGIPSSCIEQALRGVEDTTYEEQAIRLLKAKSRSLTPNDPQRYAKLARYLASRGFEPERIRRLLKTYDPEAEDTWMF